jgi:hypothetical protein
MDHDEISCIRAEDLALAPEPAELNAAPGKEKTRDTEYNDDCNSDHQIDSSDHHESTLNRTA